MGLLFYDVFPDMLKKKAEHPKPAGESIPVEHWSTGDLFHSVADAFWHKKTQGVFPKTMKKDKGSHPLYVVASSNYGLSICPCTSKSPAFLPRWYIPGGVLLRNTGEKKDRTTYVLKKLARPLMKDETVSPAFYWGMFPPEELCEEK